MAERIESYKDVAQELVGTTAKRVGAITMIITGAVAGVAREIGELVTDGFELRDAVRQARLDRENSTATIIDPDE